MTRLNLLVAAVFTVAVTAASAQPVQLVSGLQGASGSTVGPDGALYVTEGAAGRVSRIDPHTGSVTTFASGLPLSAIGIGGASDVVFIGHTAYVLVTLVGADLDDVFGPGTAPHGGSVVGVYRIDGPDSHTIIADIGAFNLANPPTISFDYFIPTGVQYAIEFFRGGLLVTDGHLNRVLWITLDGHVSEFMAFGNVVPTGLEVWGNTVYMAEAGPLPHLPQDGKVVAFGPHSSEAVEVASGAPLLVDVKRGRGAGLYALAQGFWDGAFEGSPAFPDTGLLLRVDANGTFTVLADRLNIPTSLQFIGTTAFIVTLTGEIWTVENVSDPPFGR
jgi:hypothetical protein